MRDKKLLAQAKDKPCTLQLHPYCNANTETTVAAHLPSAYKGMGLKSPDWWHVYACSTCHDIIDGRRYTDLTKAEVFKAMLDARFRTEAIIREQS